MERVKANFIIGIVTRTTTLKEYVKGLPPDVDQNEFMTWALRFIMRYTIRINTGRWPRDDY